MMTSAQAAASGPETTVKPSASAFAFDRLPSCNATCTWTPLSFRFKACACPCEPYPKMATFLFWISERSAESS